MNLTSGQSKEIEILDFFAPSNVIWGNKTDEALKAYFEWSERGLSLSVNVMQDRSYIGKLYWGKSRRDYQSKEWFKDLGVYTFLAELKEELPSNVFDWFVKSYNLSTALL